MKITPRDHVTISAFENCNRCGGEHEDLNFQRMEPPLDISGIMFTHWAICPTNNTPILLRVETVAA